MLKPTSLVAATLDTLRFTAAVARQASPFLLRILVTGPASIVLACVLAFALDSAASGSNLVRSVAAAAVEWGTAFREVPAGTVPDRRCPISLADPETAVPAPVAIEECRLVPMEQEAWVDTFTAQLLHLYELLVLATLLVYPVCAMLRWRLAGWSGTQPQGPGDDHPTPRDSGGTNRSR